jgi:hypothetical protein
MSDITWSNIDFGSGHSPKTKKERLMRPARIEAKIQGVVTNARPGLSRSASAHSLHEGADIHETIV